jgi:PAS domain S-box-containing protein
MAAGMLHYGILFGLIANLAQLPVLLLAGDPPARVLATSTLTIGMLLANAFFLRRGYVRASAVAFLAVGWLVLSAANLTAGGVEAPGYAIQVVFVICAGFIFGGRSAFVAATASALVGLAFALLEVTGRLPVSRVANTPARHWLVLASTFFVVAAILTLMVNRLRATIAAARREIVVRQRAERELERHRAGLEDTVRERTAALVATNDSLQQQIRERSRAEEALRREKDFIAQLMETSPVGILVVDAGGAFTFANAAAARVLGRRRDEITGSSCAAGAWHFTDHRGQAVPAQDLPFLRAMSGAGAVRNAALAVASPDGRRTLLSVNAAPLGGDRDRPSGCVATVEDVTDRLRMEQEILRAQKLESVGVLAGGIAHDFNNLLTAIMGNISLAQLSLAAGSPAAEALADAEKASLQARDVTQQLLTFSRGGAPVKGAVDVGEVVANATQFALLGTNVRADCALAPGLWAVDADRGQIGQVFHNLAINACQAMPGGGTLRIGAANVVVAPGDATGLAPGDYVRVTVADGGVGIPAENLAKVFDPFFTTKRGGTGLGLAVVYSVVRNHGGHVAVESAAGAGTTFTIHLPAAPRGRPAGEPPPPTTRGRGRILVMDDEPLVRQVLERTLEALGYEALTTADGAEAVGEYRRGLAEGRPFDAVVLDLTVPGGMGGAEAVRQLRALDPGVRAVVSSGYSNDPVMSNFRDHGFCSVIAKPYQANELGRVLRQVLDGG